MGFPKIFQQPHHFLHNLSGLPGGIINVGNFQTDSLGIYRQLRDDKANRLFLLTENPQLHILHRQFAEDKINRVQLPQQWKAGKDFIESLVNEPGETPGSFTRLSLIHI